MSLSQSSTSILGYLLMRPSSPIDFKKQKYEFKCSFYHRIRVQSIQPDSIILSLHPTHTCSSNGLLDAFTFSYGCHFWCFVCVSLYRIFNFQYLFFFFILCEKLMLALCSSFHDDGGDDLVGGINFTTQVVQLHQTMISMPTRLLRMSTQLITILFTFVDNNHTLWLVIPNHIQV